VPLPPGETTTLPVARFAVDVRVKRQGHAVATERVPPGEQFSFSLPAGGYSLDVVGGYPNSIAPCLATTAVAGGRTNRLDVRCVEP
jgi:hypothetical protein